MLYGVSYRSSVSHDERPSDEDGSFMSFPRSLPCFYVSHRS